MKIQEAAENYLEAILVLKQKNGQVRSIDVVGYMNYSKPTVSVVMKRFRENGYIDMDCDGYITLTEKGEEIARKTYERHTLFAEMLIRLGVDEETALRDSCKMEHAISEKSFQCIKDHYMRSKNRA